MKKIELFFKKISDWLTFIFNQYPLATLVAIATILIVATTVIVTIMVIKRRNKSIRSDIKDSKKNVLTFLGERRKSISYRDLSSEQKFKKLINPEMREISYGILARFIWKLDVTRLESAINEFDGNFVIEKLKNGSLKGNMTVIGYTELPSGKLKKVKITVAVPANLGDWEDIRDICYKGIKHGKLIFSYYEGYSPKRKIIKIRTNSLSDPLNGWRYNHMFK